MRKQKFPIVTKVEKDVSLNSVMSNSFDLWNNFGLRESLNHELNER